MYRSPPYCHTDLSISLSLSTTTSKWFQPSPRASLVVRRLSQRQLHRAFVQTFFPYMYRYDRSRGIIRQKLSDDRTLSRALGTASTLSSNEPFTILEEQGVNTHGMLQGEMERVLGNYPDFQGEKSRLEHFLLEKRHLSYLLHNYQCEFNAIERVWARLKCCTKAYCNCSFVSIQKNVSSALKSVSLQSIQSTFRKCDTICLHILRAYLVALTWRSM